jgi:hypothetical protein
MRAGSARRQVPGWKIVVLLFAVALLRILQHDADEMVAFFPCDHYYADVAAFASTVRSSHGLRKKAPSVTRSLGLRAEIPGGRVRVDRTISYW